MQKLLSPLAKELGYEPRANQWIIFIDRNGRGFAQPDLIWVNPHRIVLFEFKLTQSDPARGQCLELYVPLLSHIYSREVLSCQVFKNIRYECPELIDDIPALLKSKGYCQWHHLGE